MTKCFFCKGNMVDGFDNYMVDLKDRFIIIKNVPCHVCSQCGEVTFSGKTVARIEEMVAGMTHNLPQVTVVDYAA